VPIPLIRGLAVIRVASFDVFDTLLTRSIGGSRQVFVATGRRLHRAGLVSIEAEAYAAAREQAGWDLTPDNALHPPLDRIAGELAARLGLAQAQSTSLLEAELDTEREVCRAVPGAAARVEKARQDTGRGVAHISDTPLPEAFLRELLVREGLFRDGDRLYTSAGCGASKQEGALFDVVAADLGVVPAEIAHVGDDRWSDLAHARIHGWNAELDTRAHFTAHERRLDQDAVATDGLGPRLAAASRMGRLRALEAEGGDAGLAGIAGGVALPLLAGFGLWVLRQAQLLELDRLYFVARDGEVFREVTRQLAAQAGYGIDCRYLYGSRMAWQLASTGTSAYARHPELWFPDEESAESVSMRALLALVDLSPADAYAVTGLPMFTADRADDRLGADGWAQLQPLLAAGPMVEEIHQRARTRRDLMVRYLDQEEVTAPGRVGLVDVGWTGRAARSLEDVLLDAERPLPAVHLFLGLLGTAPARMGAELHERSQGWLLDEARGRGSRTEAEDPVMLIESFAMGREGHTVGYALEGDRVVPHLVTKDNPAALRWGLEEFRRALAQALEAFLDGPVPDTSIDLRALVWRQILSFWRLPSRAEAEAWGAQPYGEDFGNRATHPLATPVTARRMLTRLGVGSPAWREPTYWLAGTIAVSPQPWRSLLRGAQSGRRLARRLPRIPVRLRGEWAMRRRSGF